MANMYKESEQGLIDTDEGGKNETNRFSSGQFLLMR